MANNSIVKVGPWGGSDGQHEWSVPPAGGNITQIIVYVGDVINGISFTYTIHSVIKETLVIGTPTGTEYSFELGTDDVINDISGQVKTLLGGALLQQLTFNINGKVFGPYGPGGGEKFTLPITVGKVTGFFGFYSECVNSIGVQLSP